jgi:prolyl oligopeptidase PreP (S9A serine peptidase family)
MFSKIAERIIGLSDILAPVKKRGASKEEEESTIDATSSSGSSKRRRLDVQLKAEREAAERGERFFAKKQRVRYHNKRTNSVCDAVVVGVHYDDGPNNPYYTIKYKAQYETGEVLDDGSKKATIIEVEKQTTPDRLSRVPWDEDAAWKVLQ